MPELAPTPDELRRGRSLCARLARPPGGLPAEAVAALRRAATRLEEDLPGQAVSLLEELIRSQPDLAGAHTLLGLAHVKLGNEARGFAALSRAAELNPDDPVNHVYLGLIQLDRDHAEAAAAHLERALALNPLDARATAALARLRESVKDVKTAARLYGRLVVLDGGESASLRAWARALRAAGDAAAAERALVRALAREPSSYEANLMLGEVYHSRYVNLRSDAGRPWAERARRHLRRALELRPGDEAARRLLEQLK